MSRNPTKRKVNGFGERLSQIMIDRKLRPTEIEKLAHINHSDLSKYCSGDVTPTAYNLYALCKVLNVSADWLLGLTDY